MKFYVYQDITKDIEWSKSTQPNGDAETLRTDLKFKRLVQLGELGEQHLKPIKKKGNIVLYTGNAPAETYGDLVVFNRHSIIGEDENTFSDFIPQMNKALLIREYTMYKHLFKFRWMKFIRAILSFAKRYRLSIVGILILSLLFIVTLLVTLWLNILTLLCMLQKVLM